jgi:hypothetical protein
MIGLFIEETRPDYSYVVVWRQGESENVLTALEELAKHPSPNRLELWSKLHAEGPKGFAPIAFRDKKSNRVMVGNTLKMLLTFGEQSA